MSLVTFSGLGQYGIITDIPAHDLPANAWSGGQNVRFFNGKVQKFLGHQQVFGTPTKAPYWAFPVPTPTAYYWVYAGYDGSAHKMYRTDMTSHTNITRQTAAVDVNYSNSAIYDWTGGVLGGVPLFNNGVDVPQSWLLPSTGLLADLANWPASTTAKVMRVFRQFAIALDITKSGTRYKELIKWSHPADPGSVPSSWNEADATKDAGEQPLADTPGAVVDCLVMRGSNVVYKDDSVHLMQYSGRARFPFTFRGIFDEWGILAKNCAIPFFGGRHIVATGGDLDIVVHDGVSAESILDRKRRTFLRNDIDPTYYTRSFMMLRMSKQEVWFCYPSIGATLPNRALIWNWKEGGYGIRDLPSPAFGVEGVVDAGALDATWDADSETWDSDSSVWDSVTYNKALKFPLFAVPGVTKFYQGDATNQFAGSSMTSFVEKLGQSVIGVTRSGDFAYDLQQKKYISEIWPKIKMVGAGSVDVYLFGQDVPDGPITSYGPYIFTPATDSKVDVGVSARYWGIKFQSTGDVDWELTEYLAEITPDGYY